MIFFPGQWNLLVFNWDFLSFIKCPLVFKSLPILIDSFMEWILLDFLVENIYTTLFPQSHSKPWDCSYSYQDFFFSTVRLKYTIFFPCNLLYCSMFFLCFCWEWVKRKTEDLVLCNFLCLIWNELLLSAIIGDFVIKIQIQLLL
jgi:hypothetical protein